MAEGALSKVWESSGEGHIVFSSPSLSLLLGNGGGAVKKATVKIPLGGRLKLVKGFLSLTVLPSPPVKPPFKWRVELDGATVSREMKPQLSARLDDVDAYRALYDVSPILEGRQELAERLLKISYDSAHPITVAEASLLALSPDVRLRHSCAYYSGLLSLEPGEELKLPTAVSPVPRGETLIYAAFLSRSPRATLRIEAGEAAEEISGQGLRLAALAAPSHVEEVRISYPAPEVKLFPKRVALLSLVAVSREAPAPLRLSVEKVERRGGEVLVEVLLSNDGEEAIEGVEIAARQGGLSVRELRIDAIAPGASERVSLRLDASRLPQRGGRISICAKWSRGGVASCRTVSLSVS